MGISTDNNEYLNKPGDYVDITFTGVRVTGDTTKSNQTISLNLFYDVYNENAAPPTGEQSNSRDSLGWDYVTQRK